MRPILAFALALLLAPAPDGIDVTEGFDGAALPAGWKVSPASWKPADGALRGKGGGQIELAEPIGGDFDLSFEGSAASKANVEVHLVDPASGQTRLTFAFLGRYHTVLQGARACILEGGNFVAVTPDMWIWPDHRFAFHVKRAGRECTSSLDGVAGPAWTAPAAPSASDSYLLRILVASEAADAAVLLDSIRLKAARPGKGTPSAPAPAPAPAPQPIDPAAVPDVEVAKTANLEVHNHADATFVTATIAAELQKQYDFLKEWVGQEPGRIAVHIAADYPCGFSRLLQTGPEMFLQSGPIFDSQANYAHEMGHCFLFRFGRLPHWFAESMADMAFGESEVYLWKRRKEVFLRNFDTPSDRSYELGHLRVKYGKGFYPKVCRILQRERVKCLATFVPGAAIADMNEFLMTVLSEAAGEDVRPVFTKELGFDLKTRERQRGY